MKFNLNLMHNCLSTKVSRSVGQWVSRSAGEWRRGKQRRRDWL